MRPEGLRPLALAVGLAAALLAGGCPRRGTPAAAAGPMRIRVTDPLAAALACHCVEGYGQRDYEGLGRFLGQQLGREVAVTFGSVAPAPEPPARGAPEPPPDLLIGPWSQVLAEARREGWSLRPIAQLTDPDGAVTRTGVVMVPAASPAKRLEDLAGKRVLVGLAEAALEREAALALFAAYGAVVEPVVAVAESSAAVAVAEATVAAAVLSSDTLPLIFGCGAVSPEELREIGRTGEIPGITVFAGTALPAPVRRRLQAALEGVRREPELCRRLESREGFAPFAPAAEEASWADWRGPNRAAWGVSFPDPLPDALRLLWRRPLTGLGLAGLSLSEGRLFVADKSLDRTRDVWRCLDADSGQELWRWECGAPGTMDFGNSPRAQPVIAGGGVFVLGAFGDLACLDAASGAVRWQCNLLQRFGGQLPTWGTCSTPLLVDGLLIVNPGCPGAAVTALDVRTGNTVWTGAGEGAGYGSFILGTFGGVRQVVGHDAVSLGGWDPATGTRLWQVKPPLDGDFNVPTPVDLGDGTLLVCSENNGARRYGFRRKGLIRSEPLAVNPDLKPDISTPVLGRAGLYGSSGALLCLDPKTLRERWRHDGAPFDDYCALVAGKDTLLAVGLAGDLVFFADARGAYREVRRLAVPAASATAEREFWSHPVVTPHRFYCRDQAAVYAYGFLRGPP